MLIKEGKDLSAREFLSQAKFYEGYSRYSDELGKYENWNEAVDRVMDMHKEKYKHLLDNPEFQTILTKITNAYYDKKILGAQRALQFGGDQLLKHEMKLYNCFDVNTEFVTSKGIKKFSDFKDGDSTLVLTHRGNWKNAVIKSYGKQKLYNVSIRRGGNVKTFKVTKNHRWILNDGTETTDLKVDDRIYKEPDIFREFDWENSEPLHQLYWCYGYVYGDGTLNGEHSMARLCKRDRGLEERFVSMGFKTSSSASLEGDIMVYTGSYQKTLPDIDRDSPELIRAFVAGYMEADGIRNYNKHGKHYHGIQATGQESINFIRKAFPIAGINIINEINLTGQKTNFGGVRPYTIRFVTSDSAGSKYNTGWKIVDIAEAEEETVWCLEVEDDKSFILNGGIVTGNCVSGYADRPEFFNEYFYILLCGCGNGYSVQKHHVAKLPRIKTRTRRVQTHVIEDSIEGWADALGALMSSFFEGGGTHPQYEGKCVYFDSTKIRPKGAKISGGFLAPGPTPLVSALYKIEAILNERASKGFLRPIDVYDIACHAADAVISGGVRRAATICLFSADDNEMIKSKTGSWFDENPQRARSNNSMVLKRDMVDKKDFMQTMDFVREFGEPGFVFVDDYEQTFNPCVEIGMYPQLDGVSGWQGCNLTEGNGAKVHSEQDFYDLCEVSSMIGTLQAGYTNFKYVSDTTKKIFERESLLGVSVTGWMNSPDVLLNPEVLRKGANIVKATNKKVAKLIGIQPAARTTCVKPSGNASTLLGTAPATQGEHSERYFRISQMNKENPIAKAMIKLNPYMVEESVWSAGKTDYAIYWPVVAPKGSKFKKELHGTHFLEIVKMIQENWVNEGTDLDLCVNKNVRHNVSNTVLVKDGDWEDVAKYVFDNRESFAGISFIGDSGDRDYAQAPYTSVPTASEIVKKYGDASLFASGLIVDSQKGFTDLWQALRVAIYNGIPAGEIKDNQADWVRRFHKFGQTFFDGDTKAAEYCLKDVHLLHRWNKIQKNITYVDFNKYFDTRLEIDIDTTSGLACSTGACELK